MLEEKALNIVEFYEVLEDFLDAVNSESWARAYYHFTRFENVVNVTMMMLGKMNGLEDEFRKLRNALVFTPERVRKTIVKEKISTLLAKLGRYGLGVHMYDSSELNIPEADMIEGIYYSVRWLDRAIMRYKIMATGNVVVKNPKKTEISALWLSKMYCEKLLHDLMTLESSIPEIISIREKMKTIVENLMVRLGDSPDDSIEEITNSLSQLVSLSRTMYEIVKSPERARAIKDLAEKNLGISLPEVEYLVRHEISQRTAETPKPGSFDWVDEDWKKILIHPNSFVIIGAKGQGKSQLGHTLLEYYASTYNIDAYLFSPFGKDIVYKKVKDLPSWIKVVDKFGEIGTDSVVLFDEFHNIAHARRGMSSETLAIDKLVELSRQNDQTHIFVTQRSSKLDRNLIMSDAVLMIKKPSIMQVNLERQELKDFILEASDEFDKLKKDLMREIGDERQVEERIKSYVYIVCEEFSSKKKYGKMKQHGMASYWSEALSKVFRGA